MKHTVNCVSKLDNKSRHWNVWHEGLKTWKFWFMFMKIWNYNSSLETILQICIPYLITATCKFFPDLIEHALHVWLTTFCISSWIQNLLRKMWHLYRFCFFKTGISSTFAWIILKTAFCNIRYTTFYLNWHRNGAYHVGRHLVIVKGT